MIAKPQRYLTFGSEYFYNFPHNMKNIIKNHCPNIISCNLVKSEGFLIDSSRRNFYIVNYCKSDVEKWKSCTRFISKKELGFCPDFVLPDSDLTSSEIIDKFDNVNK